MTDDTDTPTSKIDTPPPIVVNESPIPGALTMALRQLAIALGGWLIGRGYLTSDIAAALGSVLMIAGPVLWGQVRHWIDKGHAVTLAAAVSDEIGIVKRAVT